MCIRDRYVTDLQLEKRFKGYNKLTLNQDYVIDKDATSLFIKIEKTLECGEEYHLKIETLQHDGSTRELLVLFTPKGLFINILHFHNSPQINFLNQKFKVY